MTKTLQQIKDEVAQGSDFIRFPTFYDHTTIPEYMIDQIAIRYAEEQNNELLEMLETIHNCVDWSASNWGDDQGNILKDRIEQLIKKATET